MKFKVYLVYALVISSVIYSVPSHWVWDSSGWLYAMGMHDLAGCSAIHSVGGVCGLLSTIWLGPRLGTFTQDEKGNNVYWPTRSSPTQVCYGTFLLWSGWMAFNSGSVLGVSNGLAYAAARAGVNTILGSVGGSIGGLVFTTIASRNKYVDIVELCTGLLSGLVAVTAACDIIRPWEAVLVGMIGGLVANGIGGVLVRFGIDDPVGVVGVHLVAGAFGTVVPGLFGSKGVFVTGSFTQLGVQVLGLVAMLGWTLATSALFLFVVDLSVGLRVPAHHERIGLDQSWKSGEAHTILPGSKRVVTDTGAADSVSHDSKRNLEPAALSTARQGESNAPSSPVPTMDEGSTMLGKRSGSLYRTMSHYLAKPAPTAAAQGSLATGRLHEDAPDITASQGDPPAETMEPPIHKPPSFVVAGTVEASAAALRKRRPSHATHSKRRLGYDAAHGVRERVRPQDTPAEASAGNVPLSRSGFPVDPLDRAIVAVAGPSTAAEWHVAAKPAGRDGGKARSASKSRPKHRGSSGSRSRSSKGQRSTISRVAAHEMYVSPALAANPEGLLVAMEEGRLQAKLSR
ncbi:amt-3, partial [Symbiodinium sp. KB8]